MFETVTDPSVIEGYLTDASNVRGHADALVRPSSAEEVAEIVRHCQTHAIPLTVSAGRSSTTAAPVPFGGWLMSLERLDRVISIDHDFATAEPGVRLGAFQAEIEAQGRFFPPDPTSRHECTLGAVIACNASGARSFQYGPTRPWIEALEVVLPTGELRTFRRGDPVPEGWPALAWHEPSVKTAAGYAPPHDALDVFIGQEGTLGVITRCTVRLTELPTSIIGFLAYFPDRESAVRFVEVARDAVRSDRHGALSPRCLEYFDHHCLHYARERIGDVPENAQTALFCEQEVEAAHEETGHLEAWWNALGEAGALVDFTVVTTDPSGQARLHALRHAIPAGINEQVIRNGMPKVGTDLAVPDAALREMMDRYEASPFEHALFGHIGDNHLHLNLLPKTADELAAARAYYVDLARRAVELGGTVSAEHGIGKLKKNQLAFMVPPEAMESFRALKRHLDPNWILGRGTLFDA
jgi:D-lactate dehydrogenase (cytochrome)